MQLHMAAISAIAAKVIIPTSGPAARLFFAAPAKLRPITITMAPVTTGGNIHSIHFIPTARTIKPINARITPAATTPPSAAAIPPSAFAAAIGAKNANEEPRYEGTRFLVINKKSIVPIPEKNKVVVGDMPVRIGTKKVAPNMAAICCKPIPIVRGQLRRSSGATTSPEVCTFHENSDDIY